MRGKEMIAMLLAGGQGSRLGILTNTKAKPAVSYGGKFRMIDFPLSNCINSGIDTVGVLTQYQPLLLNRHISNGVPWDLDRNNGGVTILQPHQKNDNTGDWYSGSANAVYQNMSYIEEYNPEHVLVLGGDHIYKMDYSLMLDFHKKNNADATIAVLEVPLEEAGRYGIMNTHDDGKVYEFAEKPKNPVSNLASMGIYIFTWKRLREALTKCDRMFEDSDFGKHIIPFLINEGRTLYAYKFNDYWKDVGTIDSYWESNMELIKTVPDFNLYEDFWRIYTSATHQPPQYTGENSDVRASFLSEGCEVYGTVVNSILGHGVIIKEGARVADSIIMEYCVVGENSTVDRCILDERCVIGKNVRLGAAVGEDAVNELKPDIYNTGITVVGEFSILPDGVSVGRNCVIDGVTIEADYDSLELPSGKSIIKERQAGI
ncbi:MAG: glucose-1-phosphate adenylyltransferase [Defluviitaleaceae bacterium]|nr:glucose-1-phosphate adenylyltransferase [Defluviitaleaceae bacterium]MCL2836428.1 glucose-1-phosphate adenylyltransferase [Defluviitaleaceae bacterium]